MKDVAMTDRRGEGGRSFKHEMEQKRCVPLARLKRGERKKTKKKEYLGVPTPNFRGKILKKERQ